MATKSKAREENGTIEQRFGVELPFTMTLRIRGVSPFLFNRMDIEAYDREAGPGAKRKPRARPEYESMVWRGEDGSLALPARNLISSIVMAGKYYKSPIAGNGSATPTLRDALVPGLELGRFLEPGSKNGNSTPLQTWDTVDFRQARHGDMKGTPKPTYRPRLEIGWLFQAPIAVTTPELYGPMKLLEIISRAGAVMGVGDGRKIGFGRYVIDSYELEDGLPW